jgi:hypothetical protein
MVWQRSLSSSIFDSREHSGQSLCPPWQEATSAAWRLPWKQSTKPAAGIVFGFQGLPPGCMHWRQGRSEDITWYPHLLLTHRELDCWAGLKALRPTSVNFILSMCLLPSETQGMEPRPSQPPDFHSLLPSARRRIAEQVWKCWSLHPGTVCQCVWAARQVWRPQSQTL